MRRIFSVLVSLFVPVLLLTGCGGAASGSTYQQISQEEAKEMMDTAAAVIPEKDSTVLVYCRSGNRSKTAASALAELGYTGIYEFGGITTWPYEIEQ